MTPGAPLLPSGEADKRLHYIHGLQRPDVSRHLAAGIWHAFSSAAAYLSGRSCVTRTKCWAPRGSLEDCHKFFAMAALSTSNHRGATSALCNQHGAAAGHGTCEAPWPKTPRSQSSCHAQQGTQQAPPAYMATNVIHIVITGEMASWAGMVMAPFPSKGMSMVSVCFWEPACCPVSEPRPAPSPAGEQGTPDQTNFLSCTLSGGVRSVIPGPVGCFTWQAAC